MRAGWRILILSLWMLTGGGSAYSQAELTKSLQQLPGLLGSPITYQRKGSEDLFSIARKYGIGAVMINNANVGDLRAGNEVLHLPTQHIAPLPQADGIVINLPERNLYLYREKKPFKVFPIAIGMRDWQTPTGDFKVLNKRKNPTWFPPEWAIEEKPVPPGPKNPLGDRWMGLSAPGIGIHATNKPSSIGRFASHGCIRMYPEHAHQLYDFVTIGMPVKIIYQVYTLGYSPEDSVIYLIHHPDPYQAGDATLDEVMQQLADLGLAEFADEKAITTALERPLGLPVPVVGSKTKVMVGGQPVKFALGPIPTNNDWLVPVGPLANALGAQLEIGERGSFAVLAHNGARLLLSLNSSEALVNGRLMQVNTPMRLIMGYPFVPIRATVTALGANVGWDEAANTILIWSNLTSEPLESALR